MSLEKLWMNLKYVMHPKRQLPTYGAVFLERNEDETLYWFKAVYYRDKRYDVCYVGIGGYLASAQYRVRFFTLDEAMKFASKHDLEVYGMDEIEGFRRRCEEEDPFQIMKDESVQPSETPRSRVRRRRRN